MLPLFASSSLRQALPWFCPEPPARGEDGELEWTFRWHSPVPDIQPQDLIWSKNAGVSFESEAARIEQEICSVPHLICACCGIDELSHRCMACQHCLGFHRCKANPGRTLWCKGSLHGGRADYERILWNLYIWTRRLHGGLFFQNFKSAPPLGLMARVPKKRTLR